MGALNYSRKQRRKTERGSKVLRSLVSRFGGRGCFSFWASCSTGFDSNVPLSPFSLQSLSLCPPVMCMCVFRQGQLFCG